MSGPFAFVPRKVARPSKPGASINNVAPRTDARASAVDKGKAREILLSPKSELETASSHKSLYSDAEYPTLLCLSLSKYKLWLDPDLRMDIQRCTRVHSNDNFFPLSYLLDTTASPLAAVQASETAIAKALRAHGAGVVDVRMAIPSSDSDSKQKRKRGMFEIRPKFWDDALEHPTSRGEWDARTVYVENMPVRCKTLPTVCKFILGVLPSDTSSSYTRIQGITSMPHHADEPGVEPKLKSFALVTFARVEDAQALVTAWPWARKPVDVDGSDPDFTDATRFGFRVCTKARWDALNEEYLAYRARILSEMQGRGEEEVEPEHESEPAEGPSTSSISKSQPKRHGQRDPPPEPTYLPYPPNCLVFVQNIDPETNKTALRGFFACAVEAGDAIDYVDFNKGMDSCHLRFTSAAHAQHLVRYFEEKPTVHSHADKEAGSKAEKVVVKAELVVGTREAVYWERVPERVRTLAVQRARGVGKSTSDGDSGGGEDVASGKRERKRRRR